MLNFIMLTISITLASLLASGLSLVIMFKLINNPKVVKWYVKWVMKYMEKFEDLQDELEEEL